MTGRSATWSRARPRGGCPGVPTRAAPAARGPRGVRRLGEHRRPDGLSATPRVARGRPRRAPRRGPARSTGRAGPRARRARERPEQAFLRMALAAPARPDPRARRPQRVHLRREPAAALLRGDAQRLLGRHLEAEAAFDAAAEADPKPRATDALNPWRSRDRTHPGPRQARRRAAPARRPDPRPLRGARAEARRPEADARRS